MKSKTFIKSGKVYLNSLWNINRKKLMLSSKLQIKEAKIEETRDHIFALDESITDLQNVLLHATEELEKLEGRKEVLKERKKNSSKIRNSLKKTLLNTAKK